MADMHLLVGTRTTRINALVSGNGRGIHTYKLTVDDNNAVRFSPGDVTQAHNATFLCRRGQFVYAVQV